MIRRRELRQMRKECKNKIMWNVNNECDECDECDKVIICSLGAMNNDNKQ